VGLFDRFRATPRQPDLAFAADGFFPIAIMQANNVEVDLHAVANAYAESKLTEGCTVHQALSAKWGGVAAIGLDENLFASLVDAYEETMADHDLAPDKSKEGTRAKYRSAATAYLGLVMVDAPGEYERFLEYIGM
jgi:hypothetical protein